MKALKWFIIFLVLLSVVMLGGMVYLFSTFSDMALEELEEEPVPATDTQPAVPEG